MSINLNHVTNTISNGPGFTLSSSDNGCSFIITMRDRSYTFSDGLGVGLSVGGSVDVGANVRIGTSQYFGIGANVPQAGSDVALARAGVNVFKITNASSAGGQLEFPNVTGVVDNPTTDSVRIGAENDSLVVIPDATGVLIIRQDGGTPNTDEIQINHNGDNAVYDTKSGTHFFRGPSSVPSMYLEAPGTFTFGWTRSNSIAIESCNSTNIRAINTFGTEINRGKYLGWASFGVALDVAMQGVSGSPIIKVNDGTLTGPGWIYDAGPRTKLSDQTNDSATLATDTHLTWTLLASGKYSFHIILSGTTDAVLEGIKAALTGTATITNLIADVEIKSHAATPVFTMGRITAFDSAIGQTVADAGAFTVEISGTFEVNAAGTFAVSWAKNADTGAANTTLLRGTHGRVWLNSN